MSPGVGSDDGRSDAVPSGDAAAKPLLPAVSASDAGRAARRRLEAVRQAAEGDLVVAERGLAATTAARADANSDDEHDPEGATIGFERAQDESLLAAARRRVTDVDLALDRLASGTYGSCSACGRPIPEARLLARPTTDRCILHA